MCADFDRLPEYILNKIFKNVTDKRDRSNLFLVSRAWNHLASETMQLDNWPIVLGSRPPDPDIDNYIGVYTRKCVKEIEHVPDRLIGNIILRHFSFDKSGELRNGPKAVLMKHGCHLRYLAVTAQQYDIKIISKILDNLPRLITVKFVPSGFFRLLLGPNHTQKTLYVDNLEIPDGEVNKWNEFIQRHKFENIIVQRDPLIFLESTFAKRFECRATTYCPQFNFPNLTTLILTSATCSFHCSRIVSRLEHIELDGCYLEFKNDAEANMTNLRYIKIKDTRRIGLRQVHLPKLTTLEIAHGRDFYKYVECANSLEELKINIYRDYITAIRALCGMIDQNANILKILNIDILHEVSWYMGDHILLYNELPRLIANANKMAKVNLCILGINPSRFAEFVRWVPSIPLRKESNILTILFNKFTKLTRKIYARRHRSNIIWRILRKIVPNWFLLTPLVFYDVIVYKDVGDTEVGLITVKRYTRHFCHQ